MKQAYKLSLFVFRRDLRLQDNSGLIAALQSSQEVIPCFIFDSRQLEQNEYKADNCIEFMARSLQCLDDELKTKNSNLYYFYGIAEAVIAKLIDVLPIEAVFVNRDYTPFSIKRDEKIAKVCKQHKVDFHSYPDLLLHEPEMIHKSDNKPYTIYTPFFHKASEIAVSYPQRNIANNYYKKDIQYTDNKTLNKLLSHTNPNLVVKGGRSEAKKLLKKIGDLKNYATSRNIPAILGTTHLSAHNKFGTISIREFYHFVAKTFGPKHTLLNELYWRDFFTHIAFHYPKVFGHEFNEKFTNIQWQTNKKYFYAWCNGETGFPIVDAGMRELNTTGYMHNRVRMITASFLIKDLHIDWRLGERYFAQKLTDYDPSVNNGNWQWAASTGCDAQPYFRIFNPWLQQEKFDRDCVYIKRWIPELNRLSPKEIHQWVKQTPLNKTNYPKPIVNHTLQAKLAKKYYKDAEKSK